MRYAILYLLIILKHLATLSAQLRQRPMKSIRVYLKSNILRNDLPQPPPPLEVLVQPKQKPSCGPVLIPGVSCEQPTTYKSSINGYYNGRFLHINKLESNPVKPQEVQRHRSILDSSIAMPMLSMMQYEPHLALTTLSIYTNDMPLHAVPALTKPRRMRFAQALFTREFENKQQTNSKDPRAFTESSEDIPRTTVGLALMVNSKSTRPPYPGGIKPDTVEVSGDNVFSCDQQGVQCHKYVWRGVPKRNFRSRRQPTTALSAFKRLPVYG